MTPVEWSVVDTGAGVHDKGAYQARPFVYIYNIELVSRLKMAYKA